MLPRPRPSVLCMTIILFSTVAMPQETPRRVTARDIYYNPSLLTPAPPSGQGPIGLQYRLTLLNLTGTASDVPDTRTFRTGDRLKFAFEVNSDAYLYVFHKSDSAAGRRLFPSTPPSGEPARLSGRRQIVLPSDGWFRLGLEPGAESLYVLVSRSPIPDCDAIPPQTEIPPDAWERVMAPFLSWQKEGAKRARPLYYADPGQQVPGAGSMTRPSQYVIYAPNTEFPMLLHEIRLNRM